MKKLIISIVTICLLLSVNFVFAEEGLSEKQSEAVSLMNDLNIFEGVTEEKASEPVTRAEFAKIIVKVIGGSDSLSASPKRIFSDVLTDNDAAASIEYLYERGIMAGYGQAEFKPDSVIALGEAVKVLVSITGYTTWAEQQGGYPNGYYALAVSNDMLRGVSGGVGEQIAYVDAAVMIQNVLESKNYLTTKGYQNSSPQYSNANDKEYMSYALNIYRYSGIMEACGSMSMYSALEQYDEGTVKIGGELFETEKDDLDKYLGMKVKAYYRADESGYHIMHIVPEKSVKVVEVQSDEAGEDVSKSQFKYYENNRLKTIDISKDAIFIYNGKRLDVVADGDLQTENGSVRLISNDNGSTYDVVVIKNYETFVVDKAIATDSTVNFKYDRGSLKLHSDNDIQPKFIQDGQEVDFSSISSGSVLSIALSKNTDGDRLAEVLISNNQVTATPKKFLSINGRKGVQLEDGTEYEYTIDYIQRLEDRQQATYEPVIGSEGTFYIDVFNKLAGYSISTAAKNYAYVVKCYYDENTEEGVIRLFTKEGAMENFNLSDKITYNNKKTDKSEIPELLKKSSPDGTVNQLIVCSTTENGFVKKIQTAENKTSESYYIAAEDEFILNAHPKNGQGVASGLRFYKNMAENKPFSFVDGQSIQFMVPTDKKNEKAYKIATKLSSTDVALPAPLYLYDAGAAGNLGAVVSNTASEGKYSTPAIVEEVWQTLDEDDMEVTEIVFVGGQSVLAGDDIIYDQPTTNWKDRVDYSNVKVNDLKKGDVIQYTTSNDRVEMLRVVVRADDVGPIRIDGDNIQLNGNMIADVISVSTNGRTAMVKYFDRNGAEVTQTMLVNSTTYRYDSTDGEVYNSSAADLRPGDKILINSYWWSPKLVVIFR